MKGSVETGNPGARVGPVLRACDLTSAVVAALTHENPAIVLVDRGSYVRVLVPDRCVLSRGGVERVLERRFVLPGDLESIMPSFRGRFSVTEEEAVWTR